MKREEAPPFAVPRAVSLAALSSTICFAGVLVSNVPVSAIPLAPEGGPFSLTGSGFVRDAVYPHMSRENVPSGLRLYGSWIAGDSTMGAVRSSWLHPVDRFRILIAGYPVDAGLSLSVEVESLGGRVRSFPIAAADPREVWTPVDVALPDSAGARRFRIAAVDGAEHLGGWLGFSEPYVLQVRGAIDPRNAGSRFALAGLVISGLASVFGLRSPVSRMRRRRRDARPVSEAGQRTVTSSGPPSTK